MVTPFFVAIDALLGVCSKIFKGKYVLFQQISVLPSCQPCRIWRRELEIALTLTFLRPLTLENRDFSEEKADH